MFSKILIANRGEIALRIMRTAARLGIRTVAVYSDADANAPHVSAAEEAIHIGPSPAPESYLKIDTLINAAKLTGAEAIHPGYGFLSENAEFAAACAEANICFIGPSADTIRTMGSKRDAKALMQAHGVPVVPGFFGEVSDEELAKEAHNIGFPVLIKASAGGGGRGMRLVHRGEEFNAALTSARREAKSAFADDSILLEKYIEQPRHIEVQIFGDSHGNVIHFFERDCSVQRRYQKLIEEAPAANLTDSQRNHIHRAAVTAGEAANYVGAGTVEFVVDRSGEVYFIEMNTRLQVEHPVTEMITGRDLVALQLEVASDAQLPAQSEIQSHGHAFELRLCAEDPSRDFAPSIGTITHFQIPEAEYRIDHGIGVGLAVSPHYDSMIAKLIVHRDDRNSAIAHAIRALEKTEVAGVSTNQAFLARILAHEEFANGRIDTHFIERLKSELLPIASPPGDDVLAIAALYIVSNRSIHEAVATFETHSPWHTADAFRMNFDHVETIELRSADALIPVAVTHHGNEYRLRLPGGDRTCRIHRLNPPNIQVQFGSTRLSANVVENDGTLDVFIGGNVYPIDCRDPLHSHDSDDGAANGLAAPMPGTVLEVFVEVGQTVTAGTSILLLEAMKIEHTITAPFDGTVKEIRFKPGDQVTAEGVALAVVEAS